MVGEEVKGGVMGWRGACEKESGRRRGGGGNRDGATGILVGTDQISDRA